MLAIEPPPSPDAPDPDPALLTDDELAALRKQRPCAHCGGIHVVACPRVRRLTYHPNGQLAGVEFWKTWPTDRVLFPDDEVLTPGSEVS